MAQKKVINVAPRIVAKGSVISIASQANIHAMNEQPCETRCKRKSKTGNLTFCCCDAFSQRNVIENIFKCKYREALF
ncbi:CLUMA_CG009150, isoform A [Clunio marinus]|uniref:CLUMA_CG009150, isoform A n=1 Tax=Clunio marinus TaxID=568069 RepID=A0A1J1I7Y7_9DIPT|nr:CLUMA_CG009150, isoform A [Clunio marinus]